DAQGRPRLDLAMRDVPMDHPDTVMALDACSEHLVAGPLFLGESPVRDEAMAKLVEFAACMRSRGVPDFPEPVAGFHGVGYPFPPDEIPYEEAGLVVAIAVCRKRIVESCTAGAQPSARHIPLATMTSRPSPVIVPRTDGDREV